MTLLASAAESIEREVAAAGSVETGGLLLGWRRSDLGRVVVASATGPGPGARMSRYGLVLDVVDLQTAVDDAWIQSSGDLTYLGDWHLHHERDPKPSETDRKSAREIASSRAIAVPQPIIMIVGEPPLGRWRCWLGAEMQTIAVEIEGDLNGVRTSS